jgi:hypothetical protein
MSWIGNGRWRLVALVVGLLLLVLVQGGLVLVLVLVPGASSMLDQVSGLRSPVLVQPFPVPAEGVSSMFELPSLVKAPGHRSPSRWVVVRVVRFGRLRDWGSRLLDVVHRVILMCGMTLESDLDVWHDLGELEWAQHQVAVEEGKWIGHRVEVCGRRPGL